MLARNPRLAGHAVAAVLLAGIAVVAAGAGGGVASASDRPDSYGGTAAASSMQFRVDKQPFPFPVTDPFHDWVPYADSSLDSSGGGEATASTIYPGQGVLGVPALLCEFNADFCHAIVEKVPRYPDYAHAQYPANPDDSATLSQKPFPGTGPFELTPNHVQAHADPSRAESTSDVSNAGLTPVVTVQNATSHSRTYFQGSTLLVTAESVLKGVDIGGQLHIDQITSTATGKVDGAKIGEAKAVTTVSGATVAGQGVTIDSTGIHAGPGGDNGLLKKTVNSALAKLASQGINVRSLGTTHSAGPQKIAAETGGVLVILTKEVSAPDLPKAGGIENGTYTLTATLGGAGINAFAAPANPVPDFQLPSTPAVTGTGAVPPPPSTTSGGTLPAQTSTTTPAGQQPAVAGTAQPKPVALPTDLTNKKLKTLALVLLAYPLLILATAPFRAPARLPRGR